MMSASSHCPAKIADIVHIQPVFFCDQATIVPDISTNENISRVGFVLNSGGSSVSQNKLPQLNLGYIYILKYLQSNFIG